MGSYSALRQRPRSEDNAHARYGATLTLHPFLHTSELFCFRLKPVLVRHQGSAKIMPLSLTGMIYEKGSHEWMGEGERRRVSVVLRTTELSIEPRTVQKLCDVVNIPWQPQT